MTKLTLALTVLTLTACGGGPSSSSGSGATPTSGWPTYSVATGATLPTCTGDVIGRLYYVEDQANFQTCKTTGWTVINVGNSISSTTHCLKSSGSYSFDYFVTTMTNGEKYTTCTVWGSAIGVTNSYYWKVANATAEGCITFYDIDAASSGFWSFSNTSGTRRAVYTDASSASNNSAVTYAPADCSTY